MDSTASRRRASGRSSVVESIKGFTFAGVRISKEDLRRRITMPEYLRLAIREAIKNKDVDTVRRHLDMAYAAGAEIPQPAEAPIIVFINSKSGGRHGPQLKARLQELMGEEQVFDLSDVMPHEFVQYGLSCLEKFAALGDSCAKVTRERIRVVAAGGDGTVGWILGCLGELKKQGREPVPPTGIIPLGTGNDLSRSFGWGGSFPFNWKSATKSILDRVATGSINRLDSWNLLISMPAGEKLETPHSLKPTEDASLDQELEIDGELPKKLSNYQGVYYNYFSIGMDAQVAYGFHHLRNEKPYLAQGPISNKLIYSGYSCTQGWFFTPCSSDPCLRGLNNILRLYVKKVNSSKWEQISVPSSVRSIVTLNLPSYGGGRNPWGRLKPEYLEKVVRQMSLYKHASENRAQTPEEKSKVLCLKLELQKLAKIEEVSWRQKSRCLWLKEGDRNTKYFQKVANGRRRNNTIDKLKIGEVIVDDKVVIKEEILSFYQQLYTENEPWRPTVSFENMASISMDERDWLERNFEEEEIHATIKACAPDKAPGPDGFTMAFFQKAWEVIKYEVIGALNHFHHNCHMVKSYNASFISLIPKKKGSIELKDYRPISLIGSVYKLTAKILAERLKSVIGKLVSGYQNAFVKGRQISDAVLIANEVLDWKQKSGDAGLLFKLDIEKAFDKLNWAYLFTILRRMGFGNRWIRWIKYSLTTVKYSVLINRGPVGFFSPQKGLRQGDPLSPFLFILAMEGLSKMFQKACQLQWIEGFKVGSPTGNNVTVSHLLYADDTLLFCGADRSQVIKLNLILHIFEAVSGLHTNMSKSTIYPVNSVQNLVELAGIMCCNIGSFPTTYLGLPLGANFKANEIWSGIIEKFEKRLATWQMQYLSFGGRVTLINSVMDSIPTYHMSLFPIPAKVLEKLDRMRRNFLWEGNSKDHKFHLVKWAKVTQPKSQGGLGIKDLAAHNKSMMMKWLWRYGTEDIGLWKEVIKAKHGELTHWSTNVSADAYGVGLWKSISKLWPDFAGNVTFRVGNGSHIKFWKDIWLGDTTLGEEFPSLHIIAAEPNSTIASNRSNDIWDLRFRRNLNDWELNDIFALFAKLQPCSFSPQGPDRLKWGNSRKGHYTVKEGYHSLCSRNSMIDKWPWKHIWKTKLPTKVICFCWTALHNSCLTQDNLSKRKLQLANRCYFCHKHTENVNHLLLHCPAASDLWNMFCCFFGLSWVMPFSVRDALESWSSRDVEKAIKSMSMMIPGVIFWCLWTERNKRCFDGISTSRNLLRGRCLVSLFSWSKLTPVNNLELFLDFVSSIA